MGVVSALDAANEEIARQQQQMSMVKTEMAEVRSLIRRLDVNRKTVEADMQQAMAAISNLQGTVNAESELVGQIDSKVTKMVEGLEAPASGEDEVAELR